MAEGIGSATRILPVRECHRPDAALCKGAGLVISRRLTTGLRYCSRCVRSANWPTAAERGWLSTTLWLRVSTSRPWHGALTSPRTTIPKSSAVRETVRPVPSWDRRPCWSPSGTIAGSRGGPLQRKSRRRWPALSVFRLFERRDTIRAPATAHAMTRPSRVGRVLRPSLTVSSAQAFAKRQVSGFGGKVAFSEWATGTGCGSRVDRRKLFALAPSLGCVASPGTPPCTMTHHRPTADERTRRGISDAMLRLPIGLEVSADLIADPDQVLT